jgi:hypothetical protein
MSSRELVRQLLSYKAGKPLPRYSTIHLIRIENPLVVAFIRQAGESRPWGIAYGRVRDAEPKIISVPDGRNRNLVGEMCTVFAEYLLEYFRAEGQVFDPITEEDKDPLLLPQVWVPGDKHVEMFHFLEYAFWRSSKADDRKDILPTLARLCGWIHRESHLKGQQVIVDASKILRDSYVFPTDSSGLGHIGACLEWFNQNNGLNEKRLKARSQMFSHVSPTLDTRLDQDVLEPLLDKRIKAIGEKKNTKKFDLEIEEALRPELLRRWELTRLAYDLLRKDEREENPGVRNLALDGLFNYVRKFQRVERRIDDAQLGPAFTPHPETDFHGSAAAASYFLSDFADAKYVSTLIHHDEELQEEALRSGSAFYAKVISVRDEGSGRKTIPVWRIQVELLDVNRIRDRERYSPLKSAKHTLQARDVEYLDNKILEFDGEWITNKTVPLDFPISAELTNLNWVGKTLMFVPDNSSSLALMSAEAVWKAQTGPGAWLTHGKPRESFEAGIVDDVTQLSELKQ